jgi:hypothetical protein
MDNTRVDGMTFASVYPLDEISSVGRLTEELADPGGAAVDRGHCTEHLRAIDSP